MPRYLHTTSSIYGGFPPSFTAPRYPTACRACHEPLTPYIGTPGWWLFTRSRRPLGHTPERPVASATCATPISTWANVAGSLVAEYPLALGLSVPAQQACTLPNRPRGRLRAASNPPHGHPRSLLSLTTPLHAYSLSLTPLRNRLVIVHRHSSTTHSQFYLKI